MIYQISGKDYIGRNKIMPFDKERFLTILSAIDTPKTRFNKVENDYQKNGTHFKFSETGEKIEVEGNISSDLINKLKNYEVNVKLIN